MPGIAGTRSFVHPHPGGAQLALTDGSVRFVSETIDFQTFIRLCDREDRQSVGEF